MSQKVLPPDLAETLRADYKARIEESRHAVRVAVQLHGPRVVQSVISATSPMPVDRGTYRRSWYVEDVEEGVTIYNNSPHAPVIEGGRRKGARMPPIDLIAEWIRRKGIDAWPYAVALAISRRGIPGKWILKRSQIILDPLVLEGMAQSVQRRSPVRPKK